MYQFPAHSGTGVDFSRRLLLVIPPNTARARGTAYGYSSRELNKETGKRLWTIVPREAEVIRLCFDLYFKKLTLHKIARKLNELGYQTRVNQPWNHVDVRRILQYSIYSGQSWNRAGELIPSKIYPAIIKPEAYAKVEACYKQRKGDGANGRPPAHMGSGVLRCPICKSGFFYYTVRERLYYHHRDHFECDGAKIRVYH